MKQPDIDALARLLDGDLPDGEAPAEARALGAFARALEGTAGARPAFAGKLDLRAALVAAAREQATAPGLLLRVRGSLTEATSRWRYSMRLAAATGASAIALSGGGVALASQQALPSDALYGVKLALEDAGLLFIGDQVQRGEQLLTNADERMDEAFASAAADDMDGVVRALREADEAGRAGARELIQASQGRGDPSLLDVLATYSSRQRERLTALLPLLHGDAAVAANDVMVGLGRIDQRVAVLGRSCAACGPDTEATDDGRKTPAAPSRNDLVDAREFDFSDIPPASEPFSPCPCVSATSSSGPAAKDDADDAVDEAEDDAEEKPTRKPKPPAEDPGEEPGEEPMPPLPEPVDETVDEVEDEAGNIVDEVLDELPGDDPPIPPPPDSSSGGVATPQVQLP